MGQNGAKAGVMWLVLGGLIMALIAEAYVQHEVKRRVDLGYQTIQDSDAIKAGDDDH